MVLHLIKMNLQVIILLQHLQPNADIENKIVLVGGEVQYLNSDYTVSGATVTFTSPPTTGALIQIKTGQDWKLIPTITGTASTEFGYAVDCDESGNNIIIGAPLKIQVIIMKVQYICLLNKMQQLINSCKSLRPSITNAEARFGEAVTANTNFTKMFAGAPGVDRFKNKSGMVSVLKLKSIKTNVHTGPQFTALATGTIQINGTSVTVAGKNVTDIATQINNDNIANITASVNDNKLTITYADKIKKLIIIDESGNLFANVIGDQFENHKHCTKFINRWTRVW